MPYLMLKHKYLYCETDRYFLTYWWPISAPVYIGYIIAEYCLCILSIIDDKIEKFWRTKMDK